MVLILGYVMSKNTLEVTRFQVNFHVKSQGEFHLSELSLKYSLDQELETSKNVVYSKLTVFLVASTTITPHLSKRHKQHNLYED
jgi:hypothetical protein